MRQVVDVFRGTRKVNEFTRIFKLFDAFNFFFQEVLNGFDVMVRGTFDIFNTVGNSFMAMAEC
jgi:hypothetical protein